MVKYVSVLVFCLVVGWLLGSVFPGHLWPHSDCHHLGGSIRTVDGPGKVVECVIPWADTKR